MTIYFGLDLSEERRNLNRLQRISWVDYADLEPKMGLPGSSALSLAIMDTVCTQTLVFPQAPLCYAWRSANDALLHS